MLLLTLFGFNQTVKMTSGLVKESLNKLFLDEKRQIRPKFRQEIDLRTDSSDQCNSPVFLQVWAALVIYTQMYFSLIYINKCMNV